MEQQNQLLQQQQQNLQLQEQNQQQQQKLQHQQQQIHELQLQQEEVESDDDDNEEFESDLDSDEDEDDEEEEDGDNPLVMCSDMWTACQAGDVKSIISLLDAGKSVNCVSAAGMTPITLALHYGRFNAVIMLARRGADLSRVDNDGWNVLYHASQGGDCECIEWVLANTSIDINNSTDIQGDTPIMSAICYARLDAAKLLLRGVPTSSKRTIMVQVPWIKHWVLKSFSTPKT
jgi:ankyrin repeat protein